MEVVVEVAVERRCPGAPPTHPLLVRLELRERRPRHDVERHVVIREVDDGAVEPVRDRGAGRAACRVLRPEHEVVDEELRASLEEIGQGRRALVGVETVLLVDRDPGQLLPPSRQLVTPPCQLFLGFEQLEPGCQPLFTCPRLVIGHGSLLPCRYIDGVSPGTTAGAKRIRAPSPTIASATGTSTAGFAGTSFWPRVRTAITAIYAT